MSEPLWRLRSLALLLGLSLLCPPSVRAEVPAKAKAGMVAPPYVATFLRDAELLATGWLARVDGGFVRARRVAPLVPSAYQGIHDPQLPLVILLRDLTIQRSATEPAIHDRLRRYLSLAFLGTDKKQVVTARGLLPRNGVRVVTTRSRPPSIPADARWVRIDLSQQTLTAYEGDHPVLVTLLSSGKGEPSDLTHPGLFRVEHKMLYSDMHGQTDDPYVVDPVPYTLYFNKNEALHGTYWHDRFGAPTSHGCLNLSLADAHWLFDWAPPALPANWSAVEVTHGDPKTLYVLINSRGGV